MTVVRALSCVALMLAASCGDKRGPSAGAVVTRDSGGIRVVDQSGLAVPDTATLAREVISVGAVEGAAEQVLHSVSDAVRVGSDFVIASGTEILWFNSAGEFRHRAGRRGQGPGEFRSAIAHLTIIPPDSVAATEGAITHIFGPTGGYSRTIRHQNYPYSLGYLGGNRWAAFLRAREPSAVGNGVFSEDRLLLIGNEQVVDTVMRVRGELYYGTATRSVRIPHTPQAHMDAFSSRVVVAEGAEYAVKVYGSTGALELIVRSNIPPPAAPEVTESRPAAPLPSEGAGRVPLEPPRQEFGPALIGVLAGRDSTVWVYRGNVGEQQHWYQYDSQGVPRRLVLLPTNFRPTDIDSETVLGIWKDELDVPFVKLYSFGSGAH